MSEQQYHPVVCLIAEIVSVDPASIDPESDLETALGITGEDAEVLIVQFARQFNVNMEGFLIHKFFLPEHYLPMFGSNIYPGIDLHGRFQLTASHLIAVAKHGRWFDPICVNND